MSITRAANHGAYSMNKTKAEIAEYLNESNETEKALKAKAEKV